MLSNQPLPCLSITLVGVAMQAEVSELQSRPRLGLLDLIREPWMRYPLLISIGLHFSQQLSGINGVRYLFCVEMIIYIKYKNVI